MHLCNVYIYISVYIHTPKETKWDMTRYDSNKQAGPNFRHHPFFPLLAPMALQPPRIGTHVPPTAAAEGFAPAPCQQGSGAPLVAGTRPSPFPATALRANLGGDSHHLSWRPSLGDHHPKGSRKRHENHVIKIE